MEQWKKERMERKNRVREKERKRGEEKRRREKEKSRERRELGKFEKNGMDDEFMAMRIGE